jgi:hypothetical protein
VIGDKLSESDGLADIGGIYPTLLIDGMPVAKRTLHPPEIHVALHGTPTTAALDTVFRHNPASIRTDNHYIRLITLSDEPTLAHFEETGRIMAHQFNQAFKRKHPLIHKLKHRDERELNHRHSTGSTGTASFFL